MSFSISRFFPAIILLSLFGIAFIVYVNVFATKEGEKHDPKEAKFVFPLLCKSIEHYYLARVYNVVDGDTIDVQIDMGLDIFAQKRVRLLSINAPEMHGSEKEKGSSSKNALEDMILGRTIILHTNQDRKDKFGRLLGWIYSYDGQTNVNEQMVKLGYARIY